MTSVDIVIANYNGREGLELCIESIARYTPEPHRVIIYDDASTNPGDVAYLLKAAVNEIRIGRNHVGHGGALNALINGADPDTEYVAVIDNDIQIRRSGWLTALLDLADTPQVLAVCDDKDTFGYCSRGYRPEMFLLWFGLLNMSAYRDGMQVDWARADAARADEPWRSKFAALYPPEDNAEWQQLRKTQAWYSDFDRERVIFDPGATLWAKMRYENPKGYVSRPLTPWLRESFHHWGHAQHWLAPGMEYTPQGCSMRANIENELRRLREGTWTGKISP